MEGMTLVDKWLSNMLVNRSRLEKSVEYHEYSPCRVVEKDRSCDQQHGGTDNWTELEAGWLVTFIKMRMG